MSSPKRSSPSSMASSSKRCKLNKATTEDWIGQMLHRYAEDNTKEALVKYTKEANRRINADHSNDDKCLYRFISFLLPRQPSDFYLGRCSPHCEDPRILPGDLWVEVAWLYKKDRSKCEMVLNHMVSHSVLRKMLFDSNGEWFENIIGEGGFEIYPGLQEAVDEDKKYGELTYELIEKYVIKEDAKFFLCELKDCVDYWCT